MEESSGDNIEGWKQKKLSREILHDRKEWTKNGRRMRE